VEKGSLWFGVGRKAILRVDVAHRQRAGSERRWEAGFNRFELV